MPLLGLKVLITSGAIIDIILGLFLLVICIKQYNTQSRTMLPITAITIVAVLTPAFLLDYDKARLSSGIFRTGAFLQNSEILFYKDGKTSTVSVFKDGSHIILSNNGKPDASIFTDTDAYSKDEGTQTLLGILPLLHNPGAEKAAVIGMGSGLSTHALLASTHLKQVDTIEIEAAVVEAANLFRPKSEKAYTDPRSFIHIDDAKTFFTAQGDSYDIIVSEPPNPWVSGVSSLFTREFYHRIKNHMKHDAIFVQWLQLYEIDINLVATVFNALGREFSDYWVYASNNGGDMIIIAKKEGLISSAEIPTDPDNTITEILSHHDINTNNDLQLHMVSSKKILEPAFNTFSDLVNSDYFPYLENGAARSRFAQSRSYELFNILNYPVPIIRTIQTDMNVDSENYTHTKAYQPASNIYSAHILYKSLLDEEVEDKNIDGRKNQRSTFLTILKQQLASCSKDDLKHTTSLLHKLASYTLPYLSQNELRSVWRKIETSACINNTESSSELKHWVALYQAISERNFQEMQHLSEQILASNPDTNEILSVFLVTAALLGNYHSDDNNTVEILKKWGDVLAGGSPETIFATAILASSNENNKVSTNVLANDH
jgi:spermidine synthase